MQPPRDLTGDRSLTAHYSRRSDLVSEILDALAAAGHDVDALDPTVLAGVDEFHLGGRRATLAVLDSVRDDGPARVLDVGAGIGGATRTIATELGAQVLGVDLTPSFVAAATELSALVGLDDVVTFEVGDALELGQPDEDFDLVTLLHVGMNIAEKDRLFTELARVLRPAGRILVYDIMRIGPGELGLPVPWTSTTDHQHLAGVDDYLSTLRTAGLEPDDAVDHRPIVAEALRVAREDPPPVDLTHLMGPDFAEMFSNLRAAVADGVVAPTQIVARKPG